MREKFNTSWETKSIERKIESLKINLNKILNGILTQW